MSDATKRGRAVEGQSVSDNLELLQAWLDERGRNSNSFGSHAHAYEVAARKLREAMSRPAPVTDARREEIVAAMERHFKSTVEMGRGLPFAETGVSLPTKSFEGYADAILALLSGTGNGRDGV